MPVRRELRRRAAETTGITMNKRGLPINANPRIDHCLQESRSYSADCLLRLRFRCAKTFNTSTPAAKAIAL